MSGLQTFSVGNSPTFRNLKEVLTAIGKKKNNEEITIQSSDPNIKYVLVLGDSPRLDIYNKLYVDKI